LQPNILHITYDLRDRLNKDKTTAVKNLIDISNTSGNAIVIDLVRVPLFSEEKIERVSENHLQINSFGLPYGIFLKKSLDRVLNHINNSIRSGKINLSNINLVHAHKLTFEGYIGYKIAKEYSLPLILTLRQTDSRVIKNKPNLLSLYKDILQYSSIIFYLNPFSILDLKSKVGVKFYESFIQGKLYLLPNIIDLNAEINTENLFNPYELLTILRMNKESVKRKNIKRLLIALSSLKEERIKLNIIGDGDYRYKVESWVNKYSLKSSVSFLGQVPNSEIKSYYSKSGGFILPSLSESFGMVYAEALICGTPILYSKNRLGFDGFFDGVGTAVDALSIDSISQGIKDIIRNNSSYRTRIAQLNKENAFSIFSKSYIEQKYLTTISKINIYENK
jgi:hypothetical protein